MSQIVAFVWAFFATMFRRVVKRIPPAGKPAPGRIFYPPLPDTGERSALSAIRRAWQAVKDRDLKAQNEAFTDLDRLTRPTLELCALTGALAKQARSGGASEARDKASGVTRRENLGQEIADHIRHGDDQASWHAAWSAIGTIFMSFDAAAKEGKDCPFRAVSRNGKPATDRTVVAYFCRTAAMVWSEIVNGNFRGSRRDADGIPLDPKKEKPVSLETDPAGREADPAIVAEQTDPDLVRKVKDLVYLAVNEYPEDVIVLWAAGFNRIEGLRPWEGIRSQKKAYALRTAMLADIGQTLEVFRGPAVAMALQELADKYCPAIA